MKWGTWRISPRWRSGDISRWKQNIGVLKTTSLLLLTRTGEPSEKNPATTALSYQSFWTFLPKALLFSVQGALCFRKSPFILRVTFCSSCCYGRLLLNYLHFSISILCFFVLLALSKCRSVSLQPRKNTRLPWPCNTQEEKPEGAQPPFLQQQRSVLSSLFKSVHLRCVQNHCLLSLTRCCQRLFVYL